MHYLNHSFKRIVNCKFKLGIITFFYFAAIGTFFLNSGMQYFSVGGIPRIGDYMTFLAIGSGSKFFQMVVLWFLPLMLMLVFCDEFAEDFTTGYKNVLITKIGKGKYIVKSILKTFLFSFLMFLSMLLLNWLFTDIAMDGATATVFDDVLPYYRDRTWFVYSFYHPKLINLCYIIATSLIAGVVGGSCAALFIAFHNRKIVYPVGFLPWFIAFNMKKSITMALQPFTEYSLRSLLPIYIITVAAYILMGTVSVVKVIKYDLV